MASQDRLQETAADRIVAPAPGSSGWNIDVMFDGAWVYQSYDVCFVVANTRSRE